MKDYYRILEVHPEASEEVLRKAYRTLAQQIHPDRFHSSDKSIMTEKLQALNEAYEVLGNPARRRTYDERYRQAMAEGTFSMAPATPGKTRNVLLWALGTYLVVQGLLRPLLFSPGLRVMLLVAVICFMHWFFRPQTVDNH